MSETPSVAEAAPPLACACGAAAPADLPPPGHRPVACAACRTPLVRAGRVPAAAIEWGVGGGLLAALAAAFAWAAVARATGTGAAWAIVAGGFAVGLAVRAASRARSPGLQWASLGAFVVFLALGEVLLHRHALLERLVAMHAAENAAAPEAIARDEAEAMTFLDYLEVEVDLRWFAAVAAGAFAAVRLLRAYPAVAAFDPRPPAAREPAAGDDLSPSPPPPSAP